MTAPARRRILVVDDNEDNREIYSFYFEYAGWDVTVASDGLSGVETAVREPFDVIVMDLSMPNMDGVEATRRLKADARTRHVPIVIVTGHALRGMGEAAVSAGAAGYHMKPVSPEQLERHIDKLLGPTV